MRKAEGLMPGRRLSARTVALTMAFALLVVENSAFSWQAGNPYRARTTASTATAPTTDANAPSTATPPAAVEAESGSGGILDLPDLVLDESWGMTEDPWSLQVLPDGLMYRSYLAGVRESRFASAWVHEEDLGWIWDIALGGRAAIVRYGTEDPIHPEGFELQIEGAGFPRLDLEHNWDLAAADFRFGIPLVHGTERYQTKFAFYHLSSHLGDEWMVRNNTLERINYSRNVFVLGRSYNLTKALRLYGELGWAFDYDGGSEPWEVQFGVDYLPEYPTGRRGAPFFALNSHLRQELDFGGNLVAQSGWMWRGDSGQIFRTGVQYFAGKSEQYEFFNEYEEKLGFGVWYDF